MIEIPGGYMSDTGFTEVRLVDGVTLTCHHEGQSNELSQQDVLMRRFPGLLTWIVRDGMDKSFCAYITSSMRMEKSDWLDCPKD